MFEFVSAGRIICGCGALEHVAPAAAEAGRKALLVTGRCTERAQGLLDTLEAAGVGAVLFSVSGEPTVQRVREAVACASDAECDLVIGFGGGSVIDLAKAVAALLANPGDPLDYLEVIGKGMPLLNRPLPCIAIPTTAGTGAEVTKNSVLASPEHRVKVSMRHPLMIPDIAVIDPECMCSMPPAVTASTGLDALTQLLEAFITKKSNPITDGLCREGLTRAIRSLRKAYTNGNDLDAREDMAIASLLGGLALANAGLGVVHGFAGPIGGMFDAPHGMVCAALLPHAMKVNVDALIERGEKSPALGRLSEFSVMCTQRTDATPLDGIEWLQRLCVDLSVPAISAFGISEADFGDIVEKAQAASSMKGNPVALSASELLTILQNAIAEA